MFESLVAAVHLDGGNPAVQDFVRRHLAAEILDTVKSGSGDNYKSLLQQLAQREFNSTPTYRMLDQKGPDHNKCFQVAAQIGKRSFEPAWGPNKKEAEQRAAKNALEVLEPKTVNPA